MNLINTVTERVVSGSVGTVLTASRVFQPETVLSMSERFIGSIRHPEGREFMRTAVSLIVERLPRLSPACRKGLSTFLANLVLGPRRRSEFLIKEGVSPPLLIVISPTMRCNLRCSGCYAGDYSKDDDLSFETVDRVLREAEEMGICFITVAGGEPFIWPHLFKAFRAHPNILFQVYTNGTLIDREAAERLAGVGNVLPCISVEGYREETDSRRGDGVWNRVIQAMFNLREAGVPFGFSATATRQNNELVVSEEFVDFYRTQGCLIGWYFNYIPIGRSPDLSLMTTPDQRIYRQEKLPELRRRGKILLADFWNDGPLVGGCMAGGRLYLHINSDGAIEPCVFCHFATDNIKDTTLAEALKSDLFRAIKIRQPYSDNLFRPCMIIDHPHILREVVAETGARPTHKGAETIITSLSDGLDEMAATYAKLADEAWNDYQCVACGQAELHGMATVACSRR